MDLLTFLIPLSNTPQTFQILLAGVTYTLTSKWNDVAQCWFLDIADLNANPIACGIPFITGEDLLDGLEYLGIGGELLVITNGPDTTSIPTLYNLGIDSNLYFQTTSTNE